VTVLTADTSDRFHLNLAGHEVPQRPGRACASGRRSSARSQRPPPASSSWAPASYNPAQARFLSADPVRGGRANPYVYGLGDPLSASDLTGQASC
jgi:hypothetical protein